MRREYGAVGMNGLIYPSPCLSPGDRPVSVGHVSKGFFSSAVRSLFSPVPRGDRAPRVRGVGQRVGPGLTALGPFHTDVVVVVSVRFVPVAS